jgi:hypothetical protein
VDIRYAYSVNGKEYQSDRYGFFTGSTDGSASKAEIVAHYPPNSRAVCYFDPATPAAAVLNRGYTGHLLFGLVGLAFIGNGVAGILYGRAKNGIARSIPPDNRSIWDRTV